MDTITYKYPAPSGVIPTPEGNALVLSSFAEDRDTDEEQLFLGRLLHPLATARCLTTLAAVVHSRFTLSPETIAAIHDPIISAGNGNIRFEGFSGCAGVYARVDLLPGALDGVFTGGGTTNVDFNSPMLAALGGVRQKDTVLLSVGQKEVAFGFDGGTVVERKVPLPQRWLKGLTSVQHYLAGAEPLADLNRLQAARLFQRVPRAKTKSDFYLERRGRDIAFSPARSAAAVAIGGVERLRLLEPLIPHADRVRVFAHPSGSSTTWQLYFGPVCFSCSLSREPYRGYSGEGAGLDALLGELPAWLPDAAARCDAPGLANRLFSPAELADGMADELARGRPGLAADEGAMKRPDAETAATLAECLAAMGLLGYDLDARAYFYRKLPYKAERVLSLNPRLKNALRLVEKGQVELLERTDRKTSCHVQGSGVWHTVVLEGEGARCTCAWMGKYGGSRGPCKHILAVKKWLSLEDGRAPGTPLQ